MFVGIEMPRPAGRQFSGGDRRKAEGGWKLVNSGIGQAHFCGKPGKQSIGQSESKARTVCESGGRQSFPGERARQRSAQASAQRVERNRREVNRPPARKTARASLPMRGPMPLIPRRRRGCLREPDSIKSISALEAEELFPQRVFVSLLRGLYLVANPNFPEVCAFPFIDLGNCVMD
jgi:hypothetical protein